MRVRARAPPSASVDAAFFPEFRAIPGEVLHVWQVTTRTSALLDTRRRRRECAQECAQTRVIPQPTPTTKRKKIGPRTRISARSVIFGSLSKPPPSLPRTRCQANQRSRHRSGRLLLLPGHPTLVFLSEALRPYLLRRYSVAGIWKARRKGWRRASSCRWEEVRWTSPSSSSPTAKRFAHSDLGEATTWPSTICSPP